MKIGYAKLGRSFPVRYFKSSSLGGDQAVIRLLDYLRKDHEVHLVGPNQGPTDKQVYGYVPENTVNHWFPGEAFGDVATVPNDARDPRSPEYVRFNQTLDEGIKRLPKLDAWVIWLGQHSAVSSFLPPERDKEKEYVTPLISQLNYVYPTLKMLNELQVKPIWLHPDARCILRSRDLWHVNQRTILSQYDRTHVIKSWHPKHGTRESHLKYKYAGLELLVMPEEGYRDADLLRILQNPGSVEFGILTNEGQDKKYNSRAGNVANWCTPLNEVTGWELVGHFCTESQLKLNRKVEPVPNTQVRQTLRRWKMTITFPPTADSHSTKWVSAKPWECFAAGTLCFKHPQYDTQGHIYGPEMPEDLRAFLCVKSPSELVERVRAVQANLELWPQLVAQQFKYVADRMRRWRGGMWAVDTAIDEMARE